jgi:hypothetical protein
MVGFTVEVMESSYRNRVFAARMWNVPTGKLTTALTGAPVRHFKDDGSWVQFVALCRQFDATFIGDINLLPVAAN